MKNDIYSDLKKLKVIPVITIEKVDDALYLADALIEGGLPVAEITFRTSAAAEAIKLLRNKRPELLIGAGTILTIENLKKAIDCGAAFGVAPGLNTKVVEEAVKREFLFSPGVMTPTDVETALSLGVNLLKFFPAEAAGGIKMLKSLTAPYGHTGVKFMPTGGINMSNINSYLQIKEVIVVGGTWVATKEDISDGKWEKIKKNCLEIAALQILD